MNLYATVLTLIIRYCNQMLIQDFFREKGVNFCLENTDFFLVWNHNRPRLISRKVIVKCFILDSNMWSCCFKNLGVRQVDLMGVGPRPLLEGAFLPKPPPIFNYYRVHELGLWCPILELFLCQTLDLEIYIQDWASKV